MDKGAWQATYSPWGHTTKQLTLPLSLPRMMKKQPSKKKKEKEKEKTTINKYCKKIAINLQSLS